MEKANTIHEKALEILKKNQKADKSKRNNADNRQRELRYISPDRGYVPS